MLELCKERNFQPLAARRFLQEGLPGTSFGYAEAGSSSFVARLCQASGAQQPDVVTYYLLRRYMTRTGREATAAFLEDCHTFSSIASSGSRLKWARAIVASVETEAHACAILKAMTAPPSTLTSKSFTGGGTSSVSFDNSILRSASARVAAPATGTVTLTSPHSQPASVSAPSSTTTTAPSVDPSATWALVRSAVMAASPSQMLPDRLFDPLYAYVANAVQAEILPAFYANSREASILAGLTRHLPSAVESNSTSIGLTADSFDQLGCIGSGSYGAVHVWRSKDTGALYAVKAMSKKVLKLKGSVHTVIRELSCTLAVESPFVASVEFSFSDDANVYVGLPLCPHGDLERFLLSQPAKRFDENTARLYAAEIVLALKHLHQAGVMHRDLKVSPFFCSNSTHSQNQGATAFYY